LPLLKEEIVKISNYTKNMNRKLSLALDFTRVYEEIKELPPGQREGAMQKQQYPANMLPLADGDLFAGREDERPYAGFHPEPLNGEGLGLYCQRHDLEKLINDNKTSHEDREQAIYLLNYWKDKTAHHIIRSRFTQEMAEYFESDDYINDDAASFILYRLALVNLDFPRLMKRGLPGLREDVEAARLRHGEGDFFLGLTEILNVLDSVLSHFSCAARKRVGDRDPLLYALDTLRVSAPQSFHQALQLGWITGVVAGVYNWGRVDDWAGSFLKTDLEKGVIDEEGAKTLIKAFYDLMRQRTNVFNNRVVMGGSGITDKKGSELFSRLAMEAFDEYPGVEPQLTWRLNSKTREDLHDLALKLISHGRSFPLLYNDEAIIPAVSQAFKVTENEACQYSPQGCGEYVVGYSGTGTPNGIINLTKCLEAALHGGKSVCSEKWLGPPAPSLTAMGDFASLWQAYDKQVQFHVDLLARSQKLTLQTAGELSPFLLTSLLTDDCLERGRPLLTGGARRVGASLEVYGEVNAADSLEIIRTVVFEEKTYTLEELCSYIDSDFTGEGGKKVRRDLLSRTHFGNDSQSADSMMEKVHHRCCNLIRESAEKVGLDYHLAVIINNSVNTLWGINTGASADGRKKGDPLANGINPSPGSDKAGLTAFLNSLLVPSVNNHAGSVQNVKLAPELFRDHYPVIKGMMQSWFDRGGTQAMITVVNQSDLQDAYDHPEKWPNLIVRVGGFSARFVTLARPVQREILGRTFHG
jgi:pyruvate-formate lyase